uniref:Uncharacterized protein n=1 Tax=Meloidogyne enterolobii TaxID=390850 RepID=A0A6V7VI12_MELEN|nr:unnamed protein product [Meloidogyne enterolobii]
MCGRRVSERKRFDVRLCRFDVSGNREVRKIAKGKCEPSLT